MLWTGLVWLRIGTLGKVGNEPSDCIKCWELLNGCTSSTELVSWYGVKVLFGSWDVRVLAVMWLLHVP
jgi:hypothetical protein